MFDHKRATPIHSDATSSNVLDQHGCLESDEVKQFVYTTVQKILQSCGATFGTISQPQFKLSFFRLSKYVIKIVVDFSYCKKLSGQSVFLVISNDISTKICHFY